ncbi:hypothetical protein E2C00_09650 [Streptomyces sp. WAC05374]|uniref:hypothetical protein n=1 Tax=Streptomyces sp. WAC05374 TaxID=2487420 RepID=UPI000F87EC54|nr:hypothetical protein [Streptomyces sp. WAC05374]RST13418.1 hypothetical protein EF905_20380 [Streptomyces sp. WAC05374]TDF47061.1 hypothetical protein E2B92_08480 [Streptomyces sp. WAC05374]TDF57317.1 hypothetical protein E2C00_09650 [Streptomyces sp. WAC05374]TDF61422.1 hypothetical protein E2C02_00850 [Streptomyces sp. WAC05374]
MKRAHITRAAAGAATLAVLLGTAACSSGTQPADKERGTSGATKASGGFWGAHAGAAASEANPPASVPDLASRSDLVVLGTITGAEEGKEYADPGKPVNRTSNVRIKVAKSSKPGVTDAVVEFTRDPGHDLKDITGSVPQGSYVFYLRSWYEGPDGPVYSCASTASCVVAAKDGALQTPRDPEAAQELTEGTRSAAPAAAGKTAQSAPSGPQRLNSAEDVFALSTTR